MLLFSLGDYFFPRRALLAAMACLSIAGAVPALAQQDREAAIRARGQIDVCVWPDYYAISFRNPRNNELTGIDVDLARDFAADLGVKVNFVDTTFARFMDDLDAQKCDIAMFGIGQTPERAARVALSNPHLRSGIYGVTLKDNPRIRTWGDIDRPDRTVAIQTGTFMDPFMRTYLKNARLLPLDKPGAREEAVLSGRADIFMTDYPYAQRMRFQHDWAEIITPPQPLAPTAYGFAVRKGEDAWLARVNLFVQAIGKDGRLDKAAAKHGLTPIVYRP
ncbi:MAG: ABC transporter substrate-binding protein [Beijerinckiaceae bacterium]|nr:ABC transporter substrate-binding protein [Beijerinckiaceae bacterium]